MRLCLVLLFSALFVFHPAHAQDVHNAPRGEIIPGPQCADIPAWDSSTPRTCQPQDSVAWLRDLTHWRDERRIRIGYDPASARLYQLPQLAWTQSSFIQPQMMIHDRFFFDSATRTYTVDRYLSDLDQRYGGIDSVLIWPLYPNLGIDDRNQFDLVADMPGGLDAVRSMVDDFHRRNVHVLFPVVAWDQGTRPIAHGFWQTLTSQLAAIHADGVNGDTLDGIPLNVLSDSLATDHPLAAEPELGVASDEQIAWNPMSWGYWDYSFRPVVSRYKWLEPRHMVNISNRWAHDHNNDLQNAFFNGAGFESWEDIWGIWNQLTPRDAEALRRVAAIERVFASFLTSPDWQPYEPTRTQGVFASRWPRDHATFFTLVNRNEYAVDGPQLRLHNQPGLHYYDFWNGVELQPLVEDGRVTLSLAIEAEGFAAVMTTDAPLTAEQQHLLTAMHALAQRPLNSFSRLWHSLPQLIVPIAATRPALATPEAMTLIPAADFTFRVNGIEIEGMNDEGVDVQYPWEPSARRYHEHMLHIPAFYIDKYPVTNAQFKQFLDATHYRPVALHNFLRDWVDADGQHRDGSNGNYPAGWDNKPVTWVSIEDARAYAAWASKRLPHEWEWQYAAQGTDLRRFPWGGGETALPSPSYPASSLIDPYSQPVQFDQFGQPRPLAPVSTSTTPPVDHGRSMAAPDDVDAHPAGASPFGVRDLVGNVWQWTDEYTDDHTRFAILRGGSHYQPLGSRWYFPQAYELSQHGKYLLMDPSIDRSAAIGFRCVQDISPSTAPVR